MTNEEYCEQTRQQLLGKTIKDLNVSGDGIFIKFGDGTKFYYYASDGGYSTWEVTPEEGE